MSEHGRCGKCDADFTGDPIPEERRQHYSSSTHFSRKIALVDRDTDRVYAYLCPDCGHQWSRQ